MAIKNYLFEGIMRLYLNIFNQLETADFISYMPCLTARVDTDANTRAVTILLYTLKAKL